MLYLSNTFILFVDIIKLGKIIDLKSSIQSTLVFCSVLIILSHHLGASCKNRIFSDPKLCLINSFSVTYFHILLQSWDRKNNQHPWLNIAPGQRIKVPKCLFFMHKQTLWTSYQIDSIKLILPPAELIYHTRSTTSFIFPKN